MQHDEKMEYLENMINKVYDKVETIEKGCLKMEEHIDYINATYNKYRSGMNYIQHFFKQQSSEEA
jgi:archaellum component FlaC